VNTVLITVQTYSDICTVENLFAAQGRSQVFFKWGVTRCQNEVSHHIFMSFLPPVEGCLLKTWLTKGGSRAPQGGGAGYAYAVQVGARTQNCNNLPSIIDKLFTTAVG